MGSWESHHNDRTTNTLEILISKQNDEAFHDGTEKYIKMKVGLAIKSGRSCRGVTSSGILQDERLHIRLPAAL